MHSDKQNAKSLSDKFFYVNKLKDFLNRKLEILNKYLKLTEYLNSKINIDETLEIGKLLNDRQSLIDTIRSIDDEIQEFQSNYKVHTNNLKNQFQIDYISKRIEEILNRISALDRETISQLIKRKDQLKSELLNIHQGVKVTHSYSYCFLPQPRFLDIRR
jgi:uncharacterized protein YdcH (DUF465 family)